MSGNKLPLEERRELIKQLTKDQMFHDLILKYHKLESEINSIREDKIKNDLSETADMLRNTLMLLDEHLDFIKVLLLRKAGIEIDLDIQVSENNLYEEVNEIFLHNIGLTRNYGNDIPPGYLRIFAYTLVFMDFYPKYPSTY